MIDDIKLTKREKQVLEYCADGFTALEIAEAMDVSFRTANAHISAARARLKAKNKTHAVAIAIRRGYIA
jgi:DNA-binding CsgD family transcriptional regulator